MPTGRASSKPLGWSSATGYCPRCDSVTGQTTAQWLSHLTLVTNQLPDPSLLYSTKHLTAVETPAYSFPMASPLRHHSDPPALHDRAIQDLSFIRRTMEGAASFTDVPGWGLVLVGLTALAAAPLAARQGSAGRWLTVWLVEALLAVVIGGTAIWRKMRLRPRVDGSPVFSAPARKFFFGFWPAMLAGAVLTFALIDFQAIWVAGSTVPRVLPGVWLLLYGVGITTAGAFSVRAVPMMGLGLMAFGIVALLVAALSSTVLLALGFGAWQIVCGILIARRHGG